MAIFKKKEKKPAQAEATARLKVGFICLGCPKNQVNAERMMADLEAAGFTLTENIYHGADAVIINTCGFIDDAKKEAIESILEVVELKEQGLVRKVLVTGCLSQGYGDEIRSEIPEVDAVLGLGANGDIVQHVEAVLAGEIIDDCPDLGCLPLNGARKLTSPSHWAFLQIADGCDNRCAYCKIPDLRGSFRSRAVEDILTEANLLVEQGVRELVLVAQDTTRYGLDLYGKIRLPELLLALCKIEELRWIRLLYCYPDEITDELIAVIAEQPKVVKYIDLPLQHIDDGVLRAMGRRGSSAEIRALLDKLRLQIPGIAIRTTFITGFPGEDEAAFEALSAFVQEQRFAHMGVYAYSPQEGTPAYGLPDQVDPELAQSRRDILTQQQADIVYQLQQEAVGAELEVMVDFYHGYTDGFVGHSTADAPEIDTMVMFTSHENLQAGDIAAVEVIGSKDDNLLGRAV